MPGISYSLDCSLYSHRWGSRRRRTCQQPKQNSCPVSLLIWKYSAASQKIHLWGLRGKLLKWKKPFVSSLSVILLQERKLSYCMNFFCGNNVMRRARWFGCVVCFGVFLVRFQNLYGLKLFLKPNMFWKISRSDVFLELDWGVRLHQRLWPYLKTRLWALKTAWKDLSKATRPGEKGSSSDEIPNIPQSHLSALIWVTTASLTSQVKLLIPLLGWHLLPW